MNFLMRTAQAVAPDHSTLKESSNHTHSVPRPSTTVEDVSKSTTLEDVSKRTTLEGLIAEDPFPQNPTGEDGDRECGGLGSGSGTFGGASAKNGSHVAENHSDVTEDEGWITIPYKELPHNWSDVPDIFSFRSLDRSFVFPGEQVHILACLSASKQDTEVITPFRVAALMSKNGIGHTTKQQNVYSGTEFSYASETGEANHASKNPDQNGETPIITEKSDTEGDISASESLLRMEDHKRRTETVLNRFKNSYFFVRFAESDEPLWSKRGEASSESSEFVSEKLAANGAGIGRASRKNTHLSAVIDRGSFDASLSGGVARNGVKCCSLSNGDIVVLLQANVGVDFLRDPILEVLQFEKYEDDSLSSESRDNLVTANQEDPCGELLKWLLPLDRTLPPPARPLSPPPLSSSSVIGSASQKSTFSASSGSQLFSFGNFRSYSMSSLPQSTAPPPASDTTPNSRSTLDLEDWDQLSHLKLGKSYDAGSQRLLSFRGVPLEPERFSVHCGLEGMYIPGRRWRRKLEIIQPIEIHSFAADCNTDDLLCVQIKNVSPVHTPDIVIFLDAISIIFDEASNGGPPVSLPIACIEAGCDNSLPNLALRRGEEHSFILKPATSAWKNFKGQGERIERSSQPSPLQAGGPASNMRLPSKIAQGKRSPPNADQYAVLVSCRCNYSESKLFFKHRTCWKRRIARDLMISVASEMSEQTLGPSERVPQLPVQVLTLQASNLTSEDLTLTVLAPASSTSPPSVLSLNSAPSTPVSPFVGFSDSAGRVGSERHGAVMPRLSSLPSESENQNKSSGTGARSVSFDEQTVSISDVIPTTDFGCTHLWLQSTVPLGCVPSQSTATIKLQLLPLTDGIITLDTLQIDVKEKGLTYIPEQSLKINATSSIATGIA